MPAALTAALLLLAAYLVGSVPFGYLVGRLRGVNLFVAGSGNIGATNAGRVLGWRFGVLVFALDFLKGALPVALIEPAARALNPAAPDAIGLPDALRVGAAALAFLGHLFPVYLGFRGGKGVATGVGVAAVLVPGPAALGLLAWVAVVLASGYVSLASLTAVTVIAACRVGGTPDPFGTQSWLMTAFCLVAAGGVGVKHIGNVRRLAAGTESRIGGGAMRDVGLRVLHLLAVGLWFGSAAFFGAAALVIFGSFAEVVNNGPSDRTAGQEIVRPDAPEGQKKALASALGGAAVGPVFPVYFGVQAVCGGVALVTALAWRNAEPGRRVHRARVWVLAAAVLLVGVGWWVSGEVSRRRTNPARFSADEAVRAPAAAEFGAWHGVSLLLGMVTTGLAGVGLGLAARLPGADARPV